MHILDTDLMSLLEHEHHPRTQALRDRLREIGESNVYTTVISFEEQMRGWMAYIAKAKSLERQIEGYRRLRDK